MGRHQVASIHVVQKNPNTSLSLAHREVKAEAFSAVEPLNVIKNFWASDMVHQKSVSLPGGGFGTRIIWLASNAAISFESSGTQ